MNITITDKATEEVKRIIQEQFNEAKAEAEAGKVEMKEPEKIYLRIRVLGGGCSGFQHKLDLTPDIVEKIDNLYEVNGVAVVIDKRSALYLDGVIVDFHNDINNRGFSVKNPNAKTTCGCGSSFSM